VNERWQRERANAQLIRVEALRSATGAIHDGRAAMAIVFHQVCRSATIQIDCVERTEGKHDLGCLGGFRADAVAGLATIDYDNIEIPTVLLESQRRPGIGVGTIAKRRVGSHIQAILHNDAGTGDGVKDIRDVRRVCGLRD